MELFGPFCNAIGRLFLLQASQDGLILHCDFHQLLLALDAVKTGLFHTHWVVESRFWVLHTVGHLLKEDAVLALNLSITP